MTTVHRPGRVELLTNAPFLRIDGFAAVVFVPNRLQPPKRIKPQLTRLVDEAPAGTDWLHEIKYDGYRMHARLADGKAQLLTRTGLDWSKQYGFTIEALRSLRVKTAYLDGELAPCVPMACRRSAGCRPPWTSAAPVTSCSSLSISCSSTARARPNCR